MHQRGDRTTVGGDVVHHCHQHVVIGVDAEKSREGHSGRDSLEVPASVVEQRVSNLAQGALCLVLLTSPFLHVLSLVPRGALAGLLYVDPFCPEQSRLTHIQLVYGT